MINLELLIQKQFPKYEIVLLEEVQQLWQGYGQILRVYLQDEYSQQKTIIIKFVCPPNLNGISHNRKLKSYQVELSFYKQYSNKLDGGPRVPKYYLSEQIDNQTVIIMEDLDQNGYNLRKSYLDVNSVKPVIKWLAQFHKQFLHSDNVNLWDEGTYWYLSTRKEEFDKMKNQDILKQKAIKLDNLLKNCPYQTILHGDAKIANFCFSEDIEQVAAVDFQYCGKGVGVRDLAYLFDSCMSEQELESEAENLLNYYFNLLDGPKEIEIAWRKLWPICWADFERFLSGWAPSHSQTNSFSKKMCNMAIKMI